MTRVWTGNVVPTDSSTDSGTGVGGIGVVLVVSVKSGLFSEGHRRRPDTVLPFV